LEKGRRLCETAYKSGSQRFIYSVFTKDTLNEKEQTRDTRVRVTVTSDLVTNGTLSRTGFGGHVSVTSDLVTNGTLSRTGFGGHVKAWFLVKQYEILAYNEHVGSFALPSSGYEPLLGYTWLAGWRRLSPREGRTTPMRQ